MKQRDFMLGMGLLGAFSLFAQSPYTGSMPPEEGSADFYLYQVESGKWVSENRTKGGTWTTRAELGKPGLDVTITKVDGGYQINPKLNGNHSINGNNLWMDTGDAKTVWQFTPVEADGVNNAVLITAVSGPGDGYPHALGAGDDGFLSTNAPEGKKTWQLVSAKDRAAYMTANPGEADATWLIPWQDFGRNNERSALWTLKHADDGSGIGHNGIQRNAVREAWNNARNYMHYITLTDLPNGTYEVRVQGYQRENWDDAVAWKRYTTGTFPERAFYFAGASTHPFMHIADEQFTGDNKPSDHQWEKISAIGRWIPNSMEAASYIFDTGRYYNPWIKAVVTDGTLILGVIKPEGSDRDWLIYDNFEMRYVSDSTEDTGMGELQEEVNEMIAKLENYPTNRPEAIAQAIESVRTAATVNELRMAEFELMTATNTYIPANIATFHDICALAESEGIDTAEYLDIFNNATNNAGINDVTKQLRYMRRRAAAERQNDYFSGHIPAAGDFYLYNVGQQQFLCGGSDWGAHAALGMPGVLITLEEGDPENLAFHIDTHLYNGDNNHYLNYRGYMDCPKAGLWKFVPVEGKTGVYNIVQNDYQDVHVAWNPNASVNEGQGDETTVGTECRDLQADDLDAQWKLVTKEERLALMADASRNNPVDVTFMIKSPGFNNREKAGEVWTMQNCNVWDTKGNHNDYALEAWDKETNDIYQSIEGLPEGVYTIHVQGYYRNGRHADQPDAEQARYAMLYAMEETGEEPVQPETPAARAAGDPSAAETPLPNVLSESGKAPGEGHDAIGNDGTVYHVPDAVSQGTNFFKLGLYNSKVAIHKYNDDSALKIGVKKDQRDFIQDWMVADNFRLKYYGKDTSTGVEEIAVEEENAAKDSRIFNLQGIEVSNPTAPGIYISNGKKFVIR